MVEPITTVGLGAVAAYLTKDGVAKLLGPTADYLGEGLRDFTKRRAENVARIFQKASEKLGDRIESPGEVPPRVLKTVINEGSFCDDDLVADYFGGVLASSRTEQGRDDRGARIAKLLDGLSTYQIRAHYLIYATIKSVFASQGLPFNMEGRPKMQIFLPFGGFIPSMEFNESELQQFVQLLNHIFFGLAAENLIEPSFWQYGPKDKMIEVCKAAQDGGIVCQPSAIGAELFLWAFGQANKPLEYIFDSTFVPVVKNCPLTVPGACPVNAQ
ncbi:MAG: hypothetical protein OEV35_09640 [Gallionellaceae bacterium]|nr:hypothetical protein [Gallionellaceae bacterium]